MGVRDASVPRLLVPPPLPPASSFVYVVTRVLREALIPLVTGIPPIGSSRGRRRRRPAQLHGDKGYDYTHLRRWLRCRGIAHRIARKGVDSSARLGRHRWTIERTIAWLTGCRRLHRRYERTASHFLAFTSIAYTLICYRSLAK
ncbi:hypothetical protein GCM10027168_74860 [Streptomyces capparidis]